MTGIVLDTAGAGMGGAARWLTETAFARGVEVVIAHTLAEMNASTTARPIPEPAPATSARLPSSQPIRGRPGG